MIILDLGHFYYSYSQCNVVFFKYNNEKKPIQNIELVELLFPMFYLLAGS